MVAAIRNFIKRRRHQEMIKYYNRNGMLSGNATRVMLENLSVKVLSSQLGEVIVVPIHLKNDKRECINYRYLNLLSVPGKVNILILHYNNVGEITSRSNIIKYFIYYFSGGRG